MTSKSSQARLSLDRVTLRVLSMRGVRGYMHAGTLEKINGIAPTALSELMGAFLPNQYAQWPISFSMSHY